MLILLTACREEELLMTGRINGQMKMYDQTGTYLPDHSGIEVNLMQGNSIVATDVTNVRGGYLFENIPYGRYRILLSKEKYVQAWNPPSFDHVGGYAATSIDRNMFEIPTYELTLDSISYYYLYEPVYFIHLKVNGDTVIKRNPPGYPFIVYAGTTDDVSRDNYTSIGYGLLRDYVGYYPSQGTPVAVYGYLSFNNMSPLIQNVFTDTVWLRIYPLANGQNYPVLRFYPEALGTPSNVIRFVIDDLVEK
jgi:hypothetical protein